MVFCDGCGLRVPAIKIRPLDGKGRCPECLTRGVSLDAYRSRPCVTCRHLWESHSGICAALVIGGFRCSCLRYEVPAPEPWPWLSEDFQRDLTSVLNRHGVPGVLESPDYVVARATMALLHGMRRIQGVSSPWTCPHCEAPREAHLDGGVTCPPVRREPPREAEADGEPEDGILAGVPKHEAGPS